MEVVSIVVIPTAGVRTLRTPSLRSASLATHAAAAFAVLSEMATRGHRCFTYKTEASSALSIEMAETIKENITPNHPPPKKEERKQN